MKGARHLLWDLHGPDDGPVPLEAELRAYRARLLPPGEVERVEWMLTRSARGRTRLAELAGIVLRPAPERLRRRLFGGTRPGPAWPALDWRWVAAFLAVAVFAGVLVFLPRDPRPGAALPEFSVRVEGLAETRADGGTLRARPETMVRIVVEAEGKPGPGLDYGVYRLEDTRLVRLESREIEIEAHRGGAVLRTTGERLAGTEPGGREFFVAVALPSRLPDRLEVERGRDPAETLRAACGGRVIGRRIEIDGREP